MRSRETLEFLGLWERLHNPKFKPLEFEGFRKEAGLHAFTMSPSKWISSVGAVGIVSKAGRYGGTYAHSDIALEFASWMPAPAGASDAEGKTGSAEKEQKKANAAGCIQGSFPLDFLPLAEYNKRQLEAANRCLPSCFCTAFPSETDAE